MKALPPCASIVKSPDKSQDIETSLFAAETMFEDPSAKLNAEPITRLFARWAMNTLSNIHLPPSRTAVLFGTILKYVPSAALEVTVTVQLLAYE